MVEEEEDAFQEVAWVVVRGALEEDEVSPHDDAFLLGVEVVVV